MFIYELNGCEFESRCSHLNVDIVSGKMDLEKGVKVTSTIDIIKKKSAAVKKLEEEIVDIRTDDSLLEEMVNEGMTF